MAASICEEAAALTVGPISGATSTNPDAESSSEEEEKAEMPNHTKHSFIATRINLTSD